MAASLLVGASFTTGDPAALTRNRRESHHSAAKLKSVVMLTAQVFKPSEANAHKHQDQIDGAVNRSVDQVL